MEFPSAASALISIFTRLVNPQCPSNGKISDGLSVSVDQSMAKYHEGPYISQSVQMLYMLVYRRNHLTY